MNFVALYIYVFIYINILIFLNSIFYFFINYILYMKQNMNK